MIVQCPSCSKRYRVNDDNIPASGGKIRCPACSHSFVVYPESGGDEVHEPGEKTQVAKRPNMEQLLKGMQKPEGDASGGGQATPSEPEADKTEVMSGAELPDFGNLFGGGDGGADATTEMESPMGGDFGATSMGGGPDPAEDDRATQELDANIARESLNQVQNIAESKGPVDGLGGDDDATQISSPPPDLGQIPGGGPQGSGSPQQPPPEQPPSQQGRRVSAPSGPTPPPGQGPDMATQGTGAPSGPDAGHDGPWKLKTNFGLTYEFADNDSLRDWLSGRDELDGYELSADGEAFYPLTDFPQIQQGAAPSGGSGAHQAQPRASQPGGGGRPSAPGSLPGSGPAGPPPGQSEGKSPSVSGGPPSQPGGPTGSSAGGSSGPMPPAGGGGHSPFQTAASPAVGPDDGPKQPAPKEKINPDENFKPPSGDSALLNWLLWGAFGLLFVAAVILALELTGVTSFGGDEEEEETVAQQQEVMEELPEEAIEEADDDDGISERARAEAQRLLESAESDMESNRLASALDRLERAAELDPTRFQFFELQAEVHEQLGEEDEAERLREQADELRRESEGVAPPPAPEDDPED